MIELFETQKYLLLFLGMLFGGETVFLPAAYLVYIGKLEFLPMIFISIVGSVLSDGFWYFLGRKIPTRPFVQHRLYRNNEAFLQKITQRFDRYGALFIILSKFLYGTRTITQILCGIRKFRPSFYMSVNLLAIVIYLLTTFGLVIGVGGSLDFLDVGLYRKVVVVVILLVIFGSMHLWIKKIISKI